MRDDLAQAVREASLLLVKQSALSNPDGADAPLFLPHERSDSGTGRRRNALVPPGWPRGMCQRENFSRQRCVAPGKIAAAFLFSFTGQLEADARALRGTIVGSARHTSSPKPKGRSRLPCKIPIVPGYTKSRRASPTGSAVYPRCARRGESSALYGLCRATHFMRGFSSPAAFLPAGAQSSRRAEIHC